MFVHIFDLTKHSETRGSSKNRFAMLHTCNAFILCVTCHFLYQKSFQHTTFVLLYRYTQCSLSTKPSRYLRCCNQVYKCLDTTYCKSISYRCRSIVHAAISCTIPKGISWNSPAQACRLPGRLAAIDRLAIASAWSRPRAGWGLSHWQMARVIFRPANCIQLDPCRKHVRWSSLYV